MTIGNQTYRLQNIMCLDSVYFDWRFLTSPALRDTFGMTFHFCSRDGRVGDSLSESPTLPDHHSILCHSELKPRAKRRGQRGILHSFVFTYY